MLHYPNYQVDISMPVIDGMEATREIRSMERNRRQKPVIIIALTGLGSASSQQEAFSSGVDLYLTKPVRFSNLRKSSERLVPKCGGGKPPYLRGCSRYHRFSAVLRRDSLV